MILKNILKMNNYIRHGLPVPHIELVSEKEAYRFFGAPSKNEPAVESKPVKNIGSIQSILM